MAGKTTLGGKERTNFGETGHAKPEGEEGKRRGGRKKEEEGRRRGKRENSRFRHPESEVFQDYIRVLWTRQLPPRSLAC